MSFGPRQYVLVWLVLVVLGGVSFGVAHLTLGAWALPIALVIAAVKAIAVALVFMHLIEHGGSVRFAALIGIAFVLLLVVLMVVDVRTRDLGVVGPTQRPTTQERVSTRRSRRNRRR